MNAIFFCVVEKTETQSSGKIQLKRRGIFYEKKNVNLIMFILFFFLPNFVESTL